MLEFEVEYISKTEGHLIARILNEGENFSLTDNSSLGGIPITKFLSIPRAKDKNNNPRFDLFVFEVKIKSEVKKFKIGQIVELKQ